MSNIVTPGDVEKYESLVAWAQLMMREQGVINIDKLYVEYKDLIDQIFDNKIYAHNFLNQVREDGQAPRLVWHGLEPLTEFKISNLRKLRPYRVKILSCKRVFIKNEYNNIEEKIIGFLELNGERFRYAAPYELPVDELVVWAIPEVKERKNDMVDIMFEIWGYEEVYSDAGLTSIQVLDDEFKDLKSIRDCYVKIVDEDVNVALSVLALASRLNKLRDFWVMGIILQGRSSSGKSYLMSNILKPWSLLGKVEEFTRFTGAYLERKFSNLNRNLDDVIFAIYELFSNTPQQLHLTLSEGKLKVGVVDKETGEPIEFEFEGMPFMFSTTPMEGIREDLRNRIINISIDESDEQTKKILEFETKLAKDPNFADNINRIDELNMRRLAKYIDSLEKKYVIVPYADRLFEALTFWDVKLRRDWKKLLSLLHASALLFQKRRPKITLENGEEAVVATLEDFDNLLYIMPAFEETITNLPKHCKMLFEIMKKEGADEYTIKDLTVLVNRYDWKIGDNRVRQILKELAAMGLVAVDESGRPHKYSIIRDYERIDLAKIRQAVIQDLMSFAEKHGIEISEMIRNGGDSRENPDPEAQKPETDNICETEIEIQRMERNDGSIPISISQKDENRDSEAQNPGKLENQEISDDFTCFNSPLIKAPLESPQAGESREEASEA
ncbi:MAG: hypothetical protein ACXQTR_05595 [Candidatus Methanospirareceae archaeon]